MFTFKRPERKPPEPVPASGRLSDALLRSVSQGILFLDSTGRLLPQASQSLAALFRRQEFVDLTFEKLLAPLVTAKTLSAVRAQTTRLFRPETEASAEDLRVLQDVELRLPNLPDGSSTRAHSRRTDTGSAKKKNTTDIDTAVNEESPNGSRSASPSLNSASGARSRASVTMSSL